MQLYILILVPSLIFDLVPSFIYQCWFWLLTYLNNWSIVYVSWAWLALALHNVIGFIFARMLLLSICFIYCIVLLISAWILCYVSFELIAAFFRHFSIRSPRWFYHIVLYNCFLVFYRNILLLVDLTSISSNFYFVLFLWKFSVLVKMPSNLL